MKLLITFLILLITTNGFATNSDAPELNDLLIPVRNPSGMTLNGQTVTFQKTSGTGTGIESARLLYYTSTDCTLGERADFTTTSGNFTIPGSNLFGLNPSSAYQVGNNLGVNLATIQSMRLEFIGIPSLGPITFTGSCALAAFAGQACCVTVTCSTGTQTCTSPIATQTVTVN